MAAMTVMPRTGEEWTVDDLDQLPDDGLQYELLEGLLLVTPAPSLLHQRVSGNLYSALKHACPPGLEVFYAPVDWRPDPRTSLQPDLVVVALEDVEGHHLTGPIALAVEVLSPTTRRKDQVLKRSKYEEARVPSYLLVDPQEPSILVLELVEGSYVTAAEGTGDGQVRVTRPFPLAVTPRDLVRPAGGR